MRDNPDLDAAIHGEPIAGKLPKPKRRRKVGTRDAIRRRAFRILALIADLPADRREAVLDAAKRLNRA